MFVKIVHIKKASNIKPGKEKENTTVQNSDKITLISYVQGKTHSYKHMYGYYTSVQVGTRK